MPDAKDLWEKALEELKYIIPPTSYSMWILPLVPKSFEDNRLVLLSPHTFTAQTVRMSYDNMLTRTISEIAGSPVTYEILYSEELEEKYKKENKKSEKEEQKKSLIGLQTTKYDGLMQMLSDCHLNTKYKFDNFVVGSYNKLAYGAALKVAEGNADKRFNPLFIYGGSGLGKTHLMQAIGNYIFTKRKARVKYITTEEFLNDLLENLYFGSEKDTFKKGAEKNKRMTKFRQKYRDVDVLLIDDIQFIEGKARTEEELFNIFDVLYNAGKQIVLTSDRLPSEIPGISDRLRTRFEWGLMADIGTPDIETRMAIVKQLIAQDGKINLSLEVIEFLATVYKNNIRELEGAFNKVCAYSSLYGEEPTLELVKKAINYRENAKKITSETILNTVCKFYNVPAEAVKSTSRVANIAKVRKVAIYITRDFLNETWQSIGQIVGGRKYTTVMYSYDEIKKEIQTNMELSDEINTLFNIINQL